MIYEKSKSTITNTNANGEGDFCRAGFSIRGILSRSIFRSGDFVAGDFPFGGFCRGRFSVRGILTRGILSVTQQNEYHVIKPPMLLKIIFRLFPELISAQRSLQAKSVQEFRVIRKIHYVIPCQILFTLDKGNYKQTNENISYQYLKSNESYLST